MKIRPVGAELFRAGGRRGRHDEANSRFSQFCERTNKNQSLRKGLNTVPLRKCSNQANHANQSAAALYATRVKSYIFKTAVRGREVRTEEPSTALLLSLYAESINCNLNFAHLAAQYCD